MHFSYCLSYIQFFRIRISFESIPHFDVVIACDDDHYDDDGGATTQSASVHVRDIRRDIYRGKNTQKYDWKYDVCGVCVCAIPLKIGSLELDIFSF